MTSTPPTGNPSLPVPTEEEDHSKTVKLSAIELRQQLQELGVDLEPDEARDSASDEHPLLTNERNR